MRAVLCLLLALLAGCAAQSEFSVVPMPTVDLSGRWRLNPADSDDPLRLTQAFAGNPGAAPAAPSDGGRRRGGGAAAPMLAAQPIVVPTTLVAAILRWPGPGIEISQQGGVVTFSSGGESRVYEPSSRPDDSAARAARKGRRNAGPPICGWVGASLVVRVPGEDDAPGFDARYQLTEDGRRLVQVITLQGGRLSGFTLSRVWDRE